MSSLGPYYQGPFRDIMFYFSKASGMQIPVVVLLFLTSNIRAIGQEDYLVCWGKQMSMSIGSFMLFCTVRFVCFISNSKIPIWGQICC